MFNELKFTPGVGFSLLIGAVGSIYLIVQSHRYFSKLSQRRRSEVRKPDVVCYMCNANIEFEDTNSFATCRGCERLVCRNEEKQCCEWIPAIGIWECQNCHSSRVIQQKAGEWLLNQLTSRLQNPGPVNLSNEGLLGLSTTDSDDARSCTSSVSSNQKVKVREFIEELLSSMLNGPLDDVSVGQLMENESYLPLIEGQTVPSSPSDTHFELRKMLQKILDEVAKLPSLLNHSGFPLRPEEHLPYFSPKKYEQLLATAVLNKVVEDYRNPKNFEHVKPEADTTTTTTAGPPTTGATSAGSAPATGTTFDINHNKVPGKSLLNEANLRKMSLDKELKEDLYSRSLSESDESYLSDYIQKHTVPLPDLSDTTGSGPEDDVLSLKSNNTDGTWEENWLFKKRQLKSTESSIAMLVPSPTEEVKALIGDKNADEVSDLSEAGSDVEEYDSDSNLKNTTTGDTGSSPKKTLEDHTQDSLISINSIASNEPVLSEAKNELLLEEQQCAVENLVNDLISIEPCLIKTEAANPALIDSQSNAFLSGPESVLIEENNNVIKQEEVETDDIKLMQERIQNAPKQRDVDGNVLHPIGIARTIPVEGHSTECDRKEVPIDRGTNEALDASDNELPCQSGSSSPTDTSTEAVAGSVDRTSSPEDFYPSTSAISNGQLKLQVDCGLEEREHSTPIAVVTQQMWQYCEELKGILYPRKAPEPVATVSEKPPPTTENLQALLLFQKELRAANEDPSQTDIKPCKDHPIRMIPTDSSRTPVSESLPTPMEDFAARSAIYNQSIREVDCVEETIPVAEEVSKVVMDTPYTEEHVVEDTISTETIPTDSFSTSVSESLPTPMEDFALRSAEYNHSLRRMDYVEESIPVAEDATCLLTEHLEPSVANEIPTITPSVEEHAVQEAIIIEHTPTPEPIGAVSYERQVTTTVEELKADQEHNHDVLENSTETSKTVKESEVPISMEEKSQCHEPSIDDLQSLSNEKEVPIDVEVSSLVVSQPSVCVVLTNNGDTNLTNAVESDTNTLHDDVQSPSFTSEASIPIAEPDSYHCPPIPAQSEPEKQKPSETSNGHVPAVTTNGVSTDDSVEDEMLIPGSIAEREHLKWRNASPIPNNPYSPDVLQKRLEESNRRSSLIDFDRLASRDPTSPTLEVPDDSELPADSKEEDDAVENDRSLQSVLGANPNQYQRYGRDYYINDAKRACGSRKQTPDLPTQLTHSTDDEKSLLLSQKQEQPTSPISCLEKNGQQPTTEAFPFVKSSSCGNVADKNQSEDIFSAARPIEVKPDDPILKKGTKVEYLSTPAREIYLVPADEPTTPHSLGSSSELSMASRADESLTFSEDSDVTRIYEIGTGESKVIHGDIIGGEKDTGQTPPSTPTYGAQLVDTSHPIYEEQTMNKLNTLKQQESEVLSEEILGIVPQIRAPTPEPIPEEPSSPTIDRSHLLKPHLLKNKPLSPETIKFFSPKKPFSPNNLGASSSLSQSTTEIRDLPHHPMNHYHSSLHIDYPPTRPAPIHHDFIIEKEVMEVLPSVKELAKCYSGSQQDVNAVPRPLHRPKDFIRQSSDMLHEEQPQETRSGMPHVENKNRRMYCSTSSITAAEEIREGRRANVEVYNPPTFVPMAPGHSITARSLSKQIRDELKINATDDHKVQGGHTSPERPSSPVFAPGHLRSSIQFFESLREK